MTSQPTNSALQAAQPTQPAMAPNAQPPAENPLDKLRDIHLPEPIDSFPFAPGWWILLAILLIIVGYLIYRQIKYRRAIRLLVPAKNELEQLRALPEDLINGQAVAKLSALIKRICLLYFKPTMVAALSGSKWLEFLNAQTASIAEKNSKSKHPLFNEKALSLFSQAAYQKSVRIAQDDWFELLGASEQCIELIIKDAARKELSGNTDRQINNPIARGNQ